MSKVNVEFKCSMCGKENKKLVYLSNFNNYSKHFCNNKCASKYGLAFGRNKESKQIVVKGNLDIKNKLREDFIKNKTQYIGKQSSRNAKEISQSELKKLHEDKNTHVAICAICDMYILRKHLKDHAEHHHNMTFDKYKELSEMRRGDNISKTKGTTENREKTRQQVLSEYASGERTTGWMGYYVSELGHNVRSSYEERMGKFLKRTRFEYVYEKPYLLTTKAGTYTYFADFTIDDTNIVVETKGVIFDSEDESKLDCCTKMKLFKEQYPDLKLMIVGPKDYLNEHLVGLEDSILDFEDAEDIFKIIKTRA